MINVLCGFYSRKNAARGRKEEYHMGLSSDYIYYSKNISIPYPECDLYNEWKLSYLMRCVQQIASEQLDAMDMQFHKLYAQGLVFLLSREQVVLNRGLHAGETVIVTTWPVQPKGAQFRRTIAFTDAKGTRLASVYTSWLLVDPAGHRILRPSMFPYPLTVAQPTEEGEEKIAGLRAVRGEKLENGLELKVRYSNTDCNGHLNNAVYGDLVLDCLSEEVLERQRPYRFFIQYIKEAKMGSLIQTQIGNTADEWYIKGTLGSENCFEANLMLKERE